jgi:hypothetical protein
MNTWTPIIQGVPFFFFFFFKVHLLKLFQKTIKKNKKHLKMCPQKMAVTFS